MPSRLTRDHRVIFLVVSIFVFVLLNWGVWQIYHQPDLGFIWSRDTGLVQRAPNHPIIQVGDVIKSIDGLPPSESPFPFYQWERGDNVSIDYERDGVTQNAQLLFDGNAPTAFLFSQLLLFIVSLSFWLVGLWVSQGQSTASQTVLIFWAFCMVLSTLITIGGVIEPFWVSHLTVTLIWFSVPFAINLHLLFPSLYTGRWKWLVNSLFFGIAGVGSLLSIARARTNWNPPPDSEGGGSLLELIGNNSVSLWLIFGLVISTLLLVRPYVIANHRQQRREVGIILICYFLGTAPLLFFSTLPSLLGFQWSLPGDLALPFLIFIPIGYGYAISNYKMMNLENQVSRSLSVFFPILILTYLYLFIQNFSQSSGVFAPVTETLINIGTFILGLIVFNPMKNRFRKFVDSIFFDGWYDYSSVVDAVTFELSNSSDIESLTESLISTIQQAMRVHWSVLLTQRPYEDQMAPKIAGDGGKVGVFESLTLRSTSELLSALFERAIPTESQTLKELQANCLTEEEEALLSHAKAGLWVPIEGVDQFRALLILGPKRGGEGFDAEDMAILNVVAKQASIALKNAQLIEELAQKAEESDQYQRQLVSTRFEERKRIARNVHDDFIQELVGFKYQVAHTGDGYEVLDEQLSSLIKTARRICQDLRPPALDLGLLPGIRSLITQFEVNHNTQVTFLVRGDKDIDVDDNIGICIIQCTRETLSNIAKHAQADLVEIFLDLSNEAMELKIQDNGVGFDIPERIGSLMEEDHFGIVGMREHVDLVKGEFEIKSIPNQGTCLTIRVPMNFEQAGMELYSDDSYPKFDLEEVNI